jgi:hypothetical protein
MVAGAQAQTPQAYNVASDWLATYPTSTALASATTATWGPTATSHAGWSAGSLSSNWSNILSPNVGAAGYDVLTTYYLPSTGYTTSGSDVHIGTYTYTVPFQAYQLNPGATITMNMGIVTTEQLANAQNASSGEKITLPTSWTSSGAATGTVVGIAHVESIPSAGTTAGFTTTAFNIQKTFSDGASGNTVPDTVPGVFYNYGVDGKSSFDPLFSVASSGTDNVVTLNASLGPAYVAWTAPAGGLVTVNATAWDTSWSSSDNDGSPSFYIFKSNSIGANGPSSMLFSAPDLPTSGAVGGRGEMPNSFGVSSTVGTASLVAQLDSTYSAANGAPNGANWTVNQMYVSPGEVLYFVVDPSRTAGGNHSYEGGQDMVALKDSITFVAPEPSSIVLLGMASFGLVLAAFKRRRVA